LDERTLVWLGCMYRNRLREVGEEVTGLLKRLGVSFESLRDEGCCGFPLILAGYVEEATRRADDNVRRMRGAGQVVTPCPACYRAFREFYPRLLGRDLPWRVTHTTQFLCGLIDQGALEPSMLRTVRMRALYHDPCELGRHSGVFEEPRRVLRTVPGLTLREPPLSREKAVCCGGGGLLYAYFPSLSSLVAARKLRLEDRIPRGLQAVVTACPQCIVTLRQAWFEGERPPGLKVYDVAQVLNMALR